MHISVCISDNNLIYCRLINENWNASAGSVVVDSKKNCLLLGINRRQVRTLVVNQDSSDGLSDFTATLTVKKVKIKKCQSLKPDK